MPTATQPSPIGTLLREWRERRGRSQLDLALDAGISARHLSFVETGRAKPGADIVLRLTDKLELPFRERNQLLLAAGYAPVFAEHSLHDPELQPVREALDLILTGHEPYPACVVDRAFNIIAANSVMSVVATLVDPDLLAGPINLLRVVLHPRALGQWLTNLGEVHAYATARLQRQVAITGDPELAALLEEVSGYPVPAHRLDPARDAAAGHIITPQFRIRMPDGTELGFFETIATFGTASEVTTSELSIALTFPADAGTAHALSNGLHIASDRPPHK
jgi:transcriptional regulator with XRE-family HTH domain